MDEVLALAWLLKKPTGEEAYAIFVLDRLVMHGPGEGKWENYQLQATLYPNSLTAQEMAQTHTDNRLALGYDLAIPPRMHTFNVTADEAIRRIIQQPYTRPNFMVEIITYGKVAVVVTD